MTTTLLQVLLVEDNAVDALLFREMFSKEAPGSFKLTHLSRMRDAEIHLAKGGVDIVLLDMGLPDAHGIDTVRRARAASPDVPMIVLTGLDDEILADEAIKEGAQDYLIKGQIENRALPRALRQAIDRHRMQLEADLIQVHQLKYKDEFLSQVSHELRSPLFAIYQFVTLLLDNLAGEVNLQQRQYLEIILRNVKQLQAMIDDLLEVARAQAGKLKIELQCASASDAMDYAVNTLQASALANKIRLTGEKYAALPQLWADPKRIRQILIILIDNAIKFTAAGGHVQVRARVAADPKFLTLEVSDNGCGISPELTERIFERLFQASDPSLAGRKGLGLGLHICKELVLCQGGVISATSAPGKGSVFSVTLPIFSLAGLIESCFREDAHAQGPVNLIVVEMASRYGWLAEQERVEKSQTARAIVQQCLYPDRDVLLPKMCFTGGLEHYFVVAMTDNVGAEALTNRLEKQLKSQLNGHGADVHFKTSFRSLKSAGHRSGEPHSPEKIAEKLKEIINQEVLSGMAKNE